MTAVIEARGLRKHYGRFAALDGVNLTIQSGAITGLIGPNGAGKTTTLKALIGLSDFEGDLRVAGRDPRAGRHHLMKDVCFIADVGILPRWMRVDQILEYVAGVHPRFDAARARSLLAGTQIQPRQRIKALSKGMVTQLHLALVMAIDVQLLVLDEPTLGLDILYRKTFYDRLLNDYCDGDRTVVLSTHQVEEVESLLTQLVFIDRGRIVLDCQMADFADRFIEVEVAATHRAEADALGPLARRTVLGRQVYLFDGLARERAEGLGALRTPSVADVFVATMSQESAHE